MVYKSNLARVICGKLAVLGALWSTPISQTRKVYCARYFPFSG
jgi:hypothetical protein